MGLGRGGAKGGEGDDSGQMVVGTGVTMDYSAVDDGKLTVRESYYWIFCEDFFFLVSSILPAVHVTIKERQKCHCKVCFFLLAYFLVVLFFWYFSY